VGKGTKPYKVHGTFPGSYLKEIVVIGSNKSEIVKVTEIPFTNDEESPRTPTRWCSGTPPPNGCSERVAPNETAPSRPLAGRLRHA
jgi:hypothetical protein